MSSTDTQVWSARQWASQRRWRGSPRIAKLFAVAELPCPFGPYVLLKSLGTGGGGDVCLAEPSDASRGLPPVVVIKRLHGQLAEQSEFVQRFKHEAEIAVSVSSPHLVKTFDAGRVGDTFYIAMEYVAGWPLSRIIRDLQKAKHRASIHSIGDIVGGALSGLSALHTAKSRETGVELGTVHRDIAPKNIMVGEDGITRLIDLGIGKSTMQDWKTGTGIVMGSPGYMAPEQVAGEKVDQRVDIYAMGIVLWEFLTLKSYFDRGSIPALLRAQHKPIFTPPSEHAPDVPSALDEVCRRALSVDREQRFQSAQAFLDALRAALPERDEPPQLATVVGEMLVGELGQSKTELFRLLEARRAGPDLQPSAGEVVILAERSAEPGRLAAGPAEARFALAPMPSSGALSLPGYPPHAQVGNMAAMPFAEGAAFPTPYSVMIPPPRSGIPATVVASLLLLTLCLGVAITLLFVSRGGTELAPVAPVLQAEPAVVGARAVRARAEPQPAEEPPTLISTQPAAPHEAHPREASLGRKPGASITVSEPVLEKEPARERERPHEKEAAHVRAAPPVDASPAEIVNAMIERTRALRARVPQHSDAWEAADKLIKTLALEAARKELEPARRAQLEAELHALESK